MSTHSRYQKFFAEHFKDSWLQFEGFEDYFTNTICSLTSDKFGREKQKWEEEEEKLLGEQKNLAFKHYQSFVSTADCSNDIRHSFDTLETQLDSVIDTIPQLRDTLSECSSVLENSNKLRREANISITKHPQLLELLELPQLIDTSIRNSYFEEGLELHGFVTNLALKYCDIPIIQDIKEDSDECVCHMEEILLKQLQTQISLAVCLRNVGLLRRIGTYTDNKLKVKFLQLRTMWFRSIIDNINKDELQYYMCKMIDNYRVNLFDIITQYRSVFIEDKTNSLIFNSWLHRQVNYFLELLNQHIPHCTGSVLDSTLAQAMYFGMSLGRVGADFRGALVPVFQRQILKTAVKCVHRATRRFQKHSKELVTARSFSGELKLVNITPLALYTNELITMLNELRHCSPATNNLHVVAALQDSLVTVVGSTAAVLREENVKQAEEITNSVVLELLPMLDKMTKSLFNTLPAIYTQKYNAQVTDRSRWRLDLPELYKPLEEHISTSTRISLSTDTMVTDTVTMVTHQVSLSTADPLILLPDTRQNETETAQNESESETVQNETETAQIVDESEPAREVIKTEEEVNKAAEDEQSDNETETMVTDTVTMVTDTVTMVTESETVDKTETSQIVNESDTDIAHDVQDAILETPSADNITVESEISNKNIEDSIESTHPLQNEATDNVNVT